MLWHRASKEVLNHTAGGGEQPGRESARIVKKGACKMMLLGTVSVSGGAIDAKPAGEPGKEQT